MSHITTTIVVIIATLPLVLSPVAALVRGHGDMRPSLRRSTGVLWTYVIGFGLSAFWSLAFGVNILQGMTPDLGWAPATAVISGNEGFGSPIPGEFVPILFLGLIGMAWTVMRKDDVGTAIWMTLFPLAGYFLLAHFEIRFTHNPKLLPYWFFGMYIFAGIAVALLGSAIVRNYSHIVRASLVAVTAMLLMALVPATSMKYVPSWVNWSFEGYEGKQVWHEYENLMQTIDELPDGRIMSETNVGMAEYGTPLALMLIPFWSEGHPSMGGLFDKSSLTTPFHFLNTSELSQDPLLSERRFTYLTFSRMDFERGVKHLAVYDVAYYVSFTDEATSAALDYGLEVLAEPAPWTIFALPDTDRVDVATFEPVVWAGEEGFVDAALEWYDDVDNLDVWLVEDGPPEWRRVRSVGERLESPRSYSKSGSATITTFEDHTVSFTTDAVGVPHLVKVSYFPNWTVDGGEGVYRAAPSLMVVIPDGENVTLEFENRWVEDIGMVITAVTLVGLAGYAIVMKRRRKEGAE